MIQRIQSVYLLLAAIALIVLYFLPVATYFSEFSYSKLYISHLAVLTPGVDPVIKDSTIMPLAIFNGLIIAIVFMSIFMYKKRILQSRMVKLCIFMSVILVALIFFVYSPLVAKHIGSDADFSEGYGVYFILVALVMLVLANRGIIKDERLVRSADRLR